MGVYSDASLLLNAVKLLAALDFQRDRDGAQSNLTLFASFAKSCRQDVLGLPSSIVTDIAAEDATEASLLLHLWLCSAYFSMQNLLAQNLQLVVQAANRNSVAQEAVNEFALAREQYLAEVQQHFALPAIQQKNFLDIVMGVFQAACLQLEHDHAGLIHTDKENSRVLNNRQVTIADLFISHAFHQLV